MIHVCTNEINLFMDVDHTNSTIYCPKFVKHSEIWMYFSYYILYRE